MKSNNLIIKKNYQPKMSNTILLAVSDPIEFKFIKWHLNYFGYKIDKSTKDKSLIKKIKKADKKKNKQSYDLIIIELKLLEKSVLETIKEFQENRDITFIFLTSSFFPKEIIEYIISTGIKHLFCSINDFDGLLLNINDVIPLEDHAIEIRKPLFPLKIFFQNYKGLKKAAKSFINDKASILNTYSEIIKECSLRIIDLHSHEKLREYFKIEIQIKLHNKEIFKKSYFFNRNNSNLYKEIKDVFINAAIKMRAFT